MKAKVLLTTTNDMLFILDDVFETYEQSRYRHWLERAAYVFSIPGSNILEDQQQRGFMAMPKDEQLTELGLFESENFKAATKMLEGRERLRVWCNLTSYQLDCHFHADWHDNRGALTCLYYANTTWEKNWGGETIFCNRDGETELAVACKPNRVVIFPSRLDHRIANISRHAPPHRFGVVSVWGERKEE